MANTVEIIIKAIDQASGNINKATSGLDKFKTGFQSLTGVSLSAAGGIAAAATAMSKIIDFTKKAVNETVAYVSSIKDMSRLLGMSTEETSRLVQASDDLFLSQESLTTAMLAASRKGIDTSITGLKALSEQYLALNPGVERAKFLMDNFGRSGSQMGKLMEVGADGIEKAMGAIQDSLVVTDASVTNIENYKRSVDNLSDAWMGFKMTIGNAVIPQLDLLMRQLTPGVDKTEELQTRIFALNEQLVQLKKYGGMGGLTNDEVNRQIAELNAEIQRLKNELNGIPEAVDGASGSFGALAEVVIPVTSYMRELTTEMLFNEAASGLDSESAMALAQAMGLINANTMMELNALAQFRAELASGGITIDEYNVKVANLAAAWERLNAIPDASFTVTTYFNSVGQPSSYGETGGYYNPGTWTPPPGKAGGGPVWGATPYVVGEKGPELFVPEQNGTIVPNKNLGGNQVTFYGDAYLEIKEDLKDDILSQLRLTT